MFNAAAAKYAEYSDLWTHIDYAPGECTFEKLKNNE